MRPWLIILVLPFLQPLTASTVHGQLEESQACKPRPAHRPADRTASTYLDSAGLDSLITGTMAADHIPGLSACLLKDGQLKWTGSYGYTDVDQGREVTDSTLFYLASISKTVTATAVMQLWEDGLFDLEDDVNDYLPPQLRVTHPAFPGQPVTFRMLLTHTSSIDYDWDLISSLISWGSDCPIPLESFLADYLMPGGSYYSYGPFTASAPGTAYQYCNQAFALLGYLVEVLADTSFEAYCRGHIFDPLGMNETSWFLSGLDADHIAVPYQYSGGQYIPYQHYGLVVYPAAQLRTSGPQLARFLAAYMNMGRLDSCQLLDSATVDLMTTVQIPGVAPDQGLAWRVHQWPDGSLYYEHPGEVYGCRTRIGANDAEEEDTGLIVLTNGESSSGLDLIWEALWDYAMLYNRIYPVDAELSAAFMRPGVDSLWLTTRFVNHTGHAFSARAAVTSLDSALVEAVELYDDGQHGDGTAGDGIWGTPLAAQATEEEFIVSVSTTDLDDGGDFAADDVARFTTIGPVYLDHYRFTSADTVPRPGVRIKCEFILKNGAATAAARQVTSALTSLDTCAYLIDPVEPAYGDIAAGEVATGDQRQYIRFADDCPDSVYARFRFDISSRGRVFWTDTLSFFVVPYDFTAAEEIPGPHPRDFVLRPAFPNPCNTSATISFSLPAAAKADLDIFNIKGQKVRTLAEGWLDAGDHTVFWDGSDDLGREVGSGVYICRLQCGRRVQRDKIVLLR